MKSALLHAASGTLRTFLCRTSLCMAMAGAACLCMQAEKSDTIHTHHNFAVGFPINRTDIDPDYDLNAAALDSIADILETDYRIDSLLVWGHASPDGYLNKNRVLAHKRMQSLRRYLIDNLGIDSAIISARPCAVPWDHFRATLSQATFDGRDEASEIIQRGDDNSPADNLDRMNRLKRLRGGRVWKLLCAEYLPEMRRAHAEAILSAITIPEPEPETNPAPLPEPQQEPQPEPLPTPRPRCSGEWHLRTSLPAWAAAVANIAGEHDFACHWSASLSLAYSAWNYGSATRKFRTFLFRPEARFWPGDGHKGFFAEAHLAMISYNVALPSWEYRIQDRDGRCPALGGGMGIGYRLALGGSWSAEAALGIGAYSLRYDRFRNEPDGAFVDTRRRSFVGIDNVALSITYTFQSSKK